MKFPFYESFNRTTTLSASAIQMCSGMKVNFCKGRGRRPFKNLHLFYNISPMNRLFQQCPKAFTCLQLEFPEKVIIGRSIYICLKKLFYNKLLFNQLGESRNHNNPVCMCVCPPSHPGASKRPIIQFMFQTI